MKNSILYLIILVSFVSCSGSNTKDRIGVDSNRNFRRVDSANEYKEFDMYKLENDTLAQIAYIHYLNPKKILFVLKSTNKKSGKLCMLSDTALATFSDQIPDPATKQDEQEDGDMYPAYEYVYEREKSPTLIAVEPSRGNRLTVKMPVKNLCDPSCPLTSVGTLRRVRLSTIEQTGPAIPSPN